MRIAEVSDKQIREAIELVAADRPNGNVTAGAVREKLGKGSHKRIKAQVDHWLAEKRFYPDEGEQAGPKAQEQIIADTAEQLVAKAVAEAIKGKGGELAAPVIDLVRQELAHENEELRHRVDKAEREMIEAKTRANIAERAEERLHEHVKQADERHRRAERRADKARDRAAEAEKEAKDLREKLRAKKDVEKQLETIDEERVQLKSRQFAVAKALSLAHYFDAALGHMRRRKNPDAALPLKEWWKKGKIGLDLTRDGEKQLVVYDLRDLSKQLGFSGMSRDQGDCNRTVLVRTNDADTEAQPLYRLAESVLEEVRSYATFRAVFKNMMKAEGKI